MSYRNVDTEAYKKAYANKNKNKKSTKKSNLVKSDKNTSKKKEILFIDPSTGKKYYNKSNFSDVKAKAKKDMTSNKAYPLSFGETFKQSKAKGEKTFRWKNKQYHTKTKDELEKAAKERSKRYAKAKKESIPKETTPEKKLNIFQKFNKKMRGTNPDGSTRTQAEFEAARDKRRIQKRITKIKERKNQGKSYSAKNLKELEAKLN